jgi:hypothetical protein
MSTEERLDPRLIVAEGGVVRAAEFAYEGARRLDGPDGETVAEVGTVYSVLGNLKLGGEALAGASESLSYSLQAAAARGDLYHDRGGDPGAALDQARAHLQDAAQAARALGAHLAAAQADIAHVGNTVQDD